MNIENKEEIVLTPAEQKLTEVSNVPTPGTAKTIEELKLAEDNFDPMMTPSGMFGMYLPKFIDIVNNLSNKSLKRLIRALVAYPLEELKPNKNVEAEVSAYTIGDRLLQAKYLMIMYSAMEYEAKQAEAKKLAEEAKAAEQGEASPEIQTETVIKE